MTKNTKFTQFIPTTLIAATSFMALAACGGAGAAATADAAAPNSPVPGAANGGAPAASGDNASASGMFADMDKTNDPDQLTVALKYVTYTDKDGKPVIDEKAAKDLTHGMNQIFAQCKVRFVVQDYHVEDPSKSGLPYSLTSMGQLDPIRKQFQETDRLVVEFTGPWDHSTIGAGNAWTAMPGSNPPGAVIESIVATDPRIVGHELGHYLSLDHVDAQTNLLSPIVYPNSDQLTPSQCTDVRNTAQGYWKAALR